MRLRYKKFILFFTLAIMLIGMGTFSMIAPNVDFTIGASSRGTKTVTGSVLASMSEEDIRSEIVTLVKNYFDAKQQVDTEALEECVSDISHVSVQRLVTDAEYIEAYKNIECTILDDGLPEGCFRVYVYYEAKIYDIDTLLPGLTALYVKADKNGKFSIYLSAISSEEHDAIDQLDNLPKIKKKIDSTQKRLEEIANKNADVRDFYQMLESSSEDDGTEDNTDIEKEAEMSSPGADASQAPSEN
ncbi:MAG: hypothetical protein IJ733_17900 [Lachnospiraceae bacterium]|nr:hypothetical protein [Lachnospiraceae bacterium]